jgi:sugar phosphate isomerase/epimerase
MTRRELVTLGGALAAAEIGPEGFARADGGAPSPAVNPVFLTGRKTDWPLRELAAAGFRGLELTPDCLEEGGRAAAAAGLQVVAVDALPELRPYLTGSLSDAVAWRRRSTLDRLRKAMEWMGAHGASYLIVAPSRQAENYQSAQDARALLVESLRDLAGAGPSAVLLEAAPFRLFDRASEIASIVDEVAKPNVAAALDLGHTLLAGESPEAAARTLGARLRFVHLHDADVRKGFPRLDRHGVPGTGSLDRGEARAAIGGLPFAVSVASPDDPVGAAARTLKWLAQG